ncbi:hypothetical protein ABZX85_18885 [Streptomyces sp. NPDC004539]|uniref:hypothetical protein n=1 Tax=Streptomyces sp. NPDC004539 TaxID=3154280 RepID=UPI0033A27464
MTKKSLPALAAVVAALMTVGGLVMAVSDDDQGSPDAVSVTLIEFSETTLLDEPEPTTRQVDIFAEHRADAVRALRFVITVDGVVAEERLWVTSHPEKIAVRDWAHCRASEEPTPPPIPDSLDVITSELFGPSTVPPTAEKQSAGGATWETTTGLMTVAYTDNGGSYPDRTIEIKGPGGEIGTTIRNTGMSDSAAFPEWRAEWRTCRPTTRVGSPS